jgi:hypothetical protein
LFARLGRFCHPLRRPGVLPWSAAFAARLVATFDLPSRVSGGGFTDRQTASQRTQLEMQDCLGFGPAALAIVFESARQDVRSAPLRAQVERAHSRVASRRFHDLVGTDHTLFMVARLREELAAGHAVADAVDTTVRFAGRTIFFSGMTVVIGLLGLLSVRSMSLRRTGYGGSPVVVFSVLAALMFLRALLRVLAPRIDRLRILGRASGEEAPSRRMSSWVMRALWRRGWSPPEGLGRMLPRIE